MNHPIPQECAGLSTPLGGELDAAVPRGDRGAAFAVEICCGSARLTAALGQAGFEAQGVDHAANKHTPVGSVVVADLTLKAGVAALWEMLARQDLKFVHMAPPCGTASKARDIRLPKSLRGSWPEPRPLRSLESPLDSWS